MNRNLKTALIVLGAGAGILALKNYLDKRNERQAPPPPPPKPPTGAAKPGELVINEDGDIMVGTEWGVNVGLPDEIDFGWTNLDAFKPLEALDACRQYQKMSFEQYNSLEPDQKQVLDELFTAFASETYPSGICNYFRTAPYNPELDQFENNPFQGYGLPKWPPRAKIGLSNCNCR
jgi:hypothetical protein